MAWLRPGTDLKGRDIALRCPRRAESRPNRGSEKTGLEISGDRRPYAMLGDGDGAARRPYPELVKNSVQMRPMARVRGNTMDSNTDRAPKNGP